MSSKLSLHSLIVFYFVASQESITSAAEKLCLTQPTITYHIRSLEKNIGIQLLDIRRQKVNLTRAGKGLYKYVSEIYQHMVSAEKYLESLKESSLRVGISATFSSTILRAAAEFEKLYPQVKLIIRNSSSFQVADDVRDSQVDLGIVVGVDYGKRPLKNIELSPREKLVLVTSPSSALSQKKKIKLADLCGYPLILGPETSATRRILLSKLRLGGCHAPAPIIVEVSNQEWGMSLIKNGQGMSVFHCRDVEKDIGTGQLKALVWNDDIWVGATALLRENSPEHSMANNFISLVKEAFNNHN